MTATTFRVAAALSVVASSAVAQPASKPVTLKAPDGITLKATYYPADKPGPAVLLLHQCNSDRSSWATFAAAAAARGYHVLALDYRGFGESGGVLADDPNTRFEVQTVKWPADVDAAFSWLVAQPGVEKSRVAAAGASCGVNQSVQLARRHPEVKTVMLLSGNIAPDGREHLRKTPWMPVFAAASDGDGGAIEQMKWLLGWSRNPGNKMLEYKAAGHGTEMFSVEKGLQPAMLDWLDANLRNAAATPPATAANFPPTAIEAFWETLTKPGGAVKAKALYDAAKAKGTARGLWPEQELNLYGYQLMQDGNNADALLVLQMNADAFPESANVYDSVSDAYLAAGNKVEALRYAEKAVKTLGTDTRASAQFKEAIRQSAEQKIRDLKK